MRTLSKQEEQTWFEHALTALSNSGAAGRASVQYIRQNKIRLGFSRQKSTGASWFDWRRLRFGIFLRADYASRQPDDQWVCTLIAHEAKHREQGIAEALSVRGELVAWQLQYDILMDFSAQLRDAWRELRTLDPDNCADLERAVELMKQLAGAGYRIDLLPLWPLSEEGVHRLRNRGRRSE